MDPHPSASSGNVEAPSTTTDDVAASEARFRSIFESVDEGFCLCEMITDAAGTPIDYRFVEVNPLFETMTGLVDPVGRTALEMVPDLEPHWVHTYGRVAFGNEPLRFQQGSDAMQRWFDVFCVPVEPRGTFALVFKDISEARVAEASLRESVRRDRHRAALADAVRELIDPAAVQAVATRLLAEALGASRVHYVDVDADQRLSADQRAPTRPLEIATSVVAPVVSGAQTVGMLTVHHEHPHCWTQFELDLIQETAERTHTALRFARGQVELRESEERFRSMADGLPLPIWQVGIDGGLEWANTAFYDHFGASPADVAGDKWHLLAHPDHDRFLLDFAAAIEERRTFHGEVLARHAGGGWRWLESWGRPRFSSDGRYLGHLGTNADITERKVAEERARMSRERAEMLAAMITALETDKPGRTRAERLVDALVPRFADYATIEAPDLDDPVVALAHRDRSMTPILRELRTHHRLSIDDEQSLAHAAHGRLQYTADFAEATVARYSPDSAVGRLLSRLGTRSHMVVPIGLGTDISGALMVGITDPMRLAYTPGDLDFLADLASHASVLIAAAVIQEREHRISLRLQEALLPRTLVSTAMVDVAARYVASSDVLEVGGDWYDSIVLDDDRTMFVVGDVVGHGLEAAAMMGRLRAGLAALAGYGAGPGQLLHMLDHFASTAGEADYTTVCCAELDMSTRTLTYASAGHPPILVIGADGSSQWLDEGRSPPLCTGHSAQRDQATVTIPDGALMIMYTDGLVERRGESIDQGLSRLQQVAVAARHDPADRVCQKLIEMAAETPTDDDTVVLCIRLQPCD